MAEGQTLWSDDAAVSLFRDFLRVRSVAGEGAITGAYTKAAKLLRAIAEEMIESALQASGDAGAAEFSASLLGEDDGLVPGKPVVFVRIEGKDPALSAVLLNGHYDVVPAEEDKWTEGHTPFSGDLTEDGKIYGRGAQDMKLVCVQYLVALGRLLSGGWRPVRTVAISFVPDEEIGGAEGMLPFLGSKAFKSLNVGVAFDEGLANPSNAFTVFHGERTPWWVLVTAAGPTGHGSRFINNAAMEKLIRMASKAMAFRARQKALLGWNDPEGSGGKGGKPSASTTSKSAIAAAAAMTMGAGGGFIEAGERKGSEGGGGGGRRRTKAQGNTAEEDRAEDRAKEGEEEEEEEGGCSHCKAKKLGDVVTVNLTMLEGGVSVDGGKTFSLNVVPTSARAGFDIRVPPSVSAAEMKGVLDAWCREGGGEEGGVSWEFAPWATHLEEHYVTPVDDSNPWWRAFKSAVSPDALGKEDFEGIEIEAETFPAATDSRFLRKLGIPAFGFSPMRQCPVLLHEHNEMVRA